MQIMAKLMIIGDIHGRDMWKHFGDISLLINGEFEPDFDKYIFLGDYCDSFTLDNITIKKNLIDIIEFKKKYPENVVLLWGNHDVQYLYGYGKHGCSGFRPEAYFDLNDIFRKNNLLFTMAYQYDNYLFTHAGVHTGWYKFRFKEFDDQDTLAESLNWAFDMNITEIFDVGYRRGGIQKVGGPLWLDKSLAYKKPLKGYHQFVGHTYVSDTKTYNIDHNTSITFCDNQTDDKVSDFKKYYLIKDV